MQAGRAAHGVRMPRVVAGDGQQPRRVGRGGHADAGAEVAEVARVLEQHDRRRPGVGEQARERERRAPRDRHHAGRRGNRSGGGDDLRRHRLDEREHPVEDVRRERAGQRAQRVAVIRDRLDHVRSEAQRVLERVKALEHDERGIAPGVAEALHAGGLRRHRI